MHSFFFLYDGHDFTFWENYLLTHDILGTLIISGMDKGTDTPNHRRWKTGFLRYHPNSGTRIFFYPRPPTPHVVLVSGSLGVCSSCDIDTSKVRG